MERDFIEIAKQCAHLLNTFHCNFRILQQILQIGQQIRRSALLLENGFQTCDPFLRDTTLRQFAAYTIPAYLVQLVNGYSDVGQQLGMSHVGGDAGKQFPVVDLDLHGNAKLVKNLVGHLEQLRLVQQRIAADNVGVTLVEFAVPPLLRTVGTPYRLHLETLERHGKLLPVLHNKAGERNRKVIAQPLFAQDG